MEEKVKISILLQLYGKLLTDKQRQYMDYYYNGDLSLSEIADNEEITRQAVRTILIKCKKKLEEYEKKLKFFQKEKSIKEIIEKIERNNKDTKIQELLKKIKKQIDF